MKATELDAALAVFQRALNGNDRMTVREVRTLLHAPDAGPAAVVSVKQIAAGLDASKPLVSRAVAFLVKHGFVTRRPSRTDRRLVVIARTAKGTKLVTTALNL